jgi:hypothetical protein
MIISLCCESQNFELAEADYFGIERFRCFLDANAAKIGNVAQAINDDEAVVGVVNFVGVHFRVPHVVLIEIRIVERPCGRQAG